MASEPTKIERRTIQVTIDLHHEMKVDAATRDISLGELVRRSYAALREAEGMGPGSPHRKPARKRARASA